MLNKKQATDLAKNWRLGNKFRKRSLTKKHNLAQATSKNTGRVKMGIRMDIESKPREYYPALDDDGSLVFFTGNPMKRIQVSDLFVPPKATKGKRPRVPAKENTMINHKLKLLETLFQAETSVLESFLETHDFDIDNYSIMTLKEQFKSFTIQLEERTEYQLVAQHCDGREIKSSWYKDENDLSELQQKCEDSEDYESTSVLKRVVDVDEDEEDETNYGDADESIDSVDEHEMGDADKPELFRLTSLALKQIPGSPKQRATIKKLNKLRVRNGMKPLKEKEIDASEEISEARMPAMKYVIYDKKTKEVYAASTKPFDKFKISDVARDNKVNKSDLVTKKMRKGQEAGTQLKEYVGPALTPANQIAKKHGGKVKSIMVKDTKGKKTKMFYAEEEEAELEEAKFDVAFDGFEGEWTNLKDELKKMRIKISNHYDDDGRHEFTIDTNKAKLKQLMKKFGDLEMNESVEIEEAKAFDKIKFKGSDKKLASSVVDMIKSKAKPKEIAKTFKKLKAPSQELIMKALGDKSAQDLLQKGQLLNQLIGIFDEVDPKGLDGRTKEFRDKVRKLEYNKKKQLPYEMFEKKVVKEKKLKALQTKADKTGIPYGILKQVFNRGVAAWRTGHRPGTNPTQWGYARVNSFATKSKGTWGGADKDLAAKARKSMK